MSTSYNTRYSKLLLSGTSKKEQAELEKVFAPFVQEQDPVPSVIHFSHDLAHRLIQMVHATGNNVLLEVRRNYGAFHIVDVPIKLSHFSGSYIRPGSLIADMHLAPTVFCPFASIDDEITPSMILLDTVYQYYRTAFMPFIDKLLPDTNYVINSSAGSGMLRISPTYEILDETKLTGFMVTYEKLHPILLDSWWRLKLRLKRYLAHQPYNEPLEIEYVVEEDDLLDPYSFI